MELHLVGSGAPQLSSSASYCPALPPPPPFGPSGSRCRKRRHVPAVRSASGSASAVGFGLQRSAKKELSMILRAEAAVLGVERKAGGTSAKFTRLWPRAVLEALDLSIAANRWEAALKFRMHKPTSPA